ncbi:hypothetical protein HHK36_023515 [Tetracentron sinense]|uniref:non-specific serine/threonine protein kinase n=1 Tax=Tetracentron sinense TaxID=13715 RepID=A0A835D5G5_TETSI|nr:hypothetical protein HHK36_023515 [Tetracentron sinense]
MLVSNLKLSMLPLWVQVHGIPPEYLSHEVGTIIGEKIGNIEDIDIPDKGLSREKFLRLRIQINISNPLRLYVFLTLLSNKPTAFPVTYERLPTCCYFCGRLGHNDKHCQAKFSWTIPATPPAWDEEGAEIFGLWRRAELFHFQSWPLRDLLASIHHRPTPTSAAPISFMAVDDDPSRDSTTELDAGSTNCTSAATTSARAAKESLMVPTATKDTTRGILGPVPVLMTDQRIMHALNRGGILPIHTNVEITQKPLRRKFPEGVRSPPPHPKKAQTELLRAIDMAEMENIQGTRQHDPSEEISAAVEGNDPVTGNIISTTIGGKNGESKRTISYMAERVVGTGSFGIVFQAKCLETGETLAIKKVLQDRRYKNRELQLMRSMDHPNVISLKHCFFSTTSKNELFLNLVMEYIPETVYRVLKHYSNVNQRMPLIYVKLYTYQVGDVFQIFRGLAYIHTGPGVCHRDVKPQNLLVDPLTHQVKLCDFGSAKVLIKGEANISYICSRYYRAPELIFGATEYTTSIDIWSGGCVLAELLLGEPLFPGESAVDQLVEIIKVLGTPTREEIRCMNPNYNDFRFPQMKAHPWHKVFHKRMPPEAIDLASRLLQYSPSLRCTALEACAHPFFDELRQSNTRLPNGRPLPPLFNFKQELSGSSPELINKLIPEHVRRLISLNFLHPTGT